MFGMTQKVQMVISGDSSGAVGAIKRVSDEAGRLNSRGGGFLRRFAGGLAHIGKVALIAAGSAGVGALTAAIGALSIVLIKGFGRLNSIDQATARLKGLGYTMKQIKEIGDQAMQSVLGTAFGYDEAITISTTALAAGVTTKNKQLLSYLKLVGDAATQAGTTMGEMGAIFNKVKAGGFSGEIANQLTDRGVPIVTWMQELAKQRHIKYDPEKMTSLPQGLFFEAMQEHVGGSAQKLGNATLSGAWANTQAAIARMGASLLGGTKGAKGGVFQTLRKSLVGVIAGIDKLTKPLAKVGDRIGRNLRKAFGGKDLQKNITNATVAIGKFLAKLALFLTSRKVVNVIKGIAKWLWNMAGAVKGFVTSEGFVNAMKAIGGVLLTTGKVILKFFSSDTLAKIGGITAALAAFSIVSKVKAAGGMLQLGMTIGKLLLPLKAVVTLLMGPWGIAIAAIGIAAFLIIKHWDKVWPVLQKVGSVIWKVLGPAITFVGGVVKWAIKHWRGLLDAFLIAAGPIGWVVAYVIHHFDRVKSALGKAWDWLKGKWDWLWDAFKNSPYGKVLSGVVSAVKSAVGLIRDHWEGIKTVFVNVINWVVRNVLRKAFGWTGITFPEIGVSHTPTPSDMAAHAEGALVKKPEIALIGEDGPELVLPLTKPKRMAELLKKVGIDPYAEGGFVGNVSAFFSKAWDKAKDIKDVVGHFLSSAVNTITSRLPDTGFMKLGQVVSHAILAGASRLIHALDSKRRAVGKGGKVYGETPGKRGQVVDYALGQVGKPYVWGGTGPDGYDCSGLVYASYRHAGMSIPRIPVYGGKVIGQKDMQPADVLLYNPGAVQEGGRVPFGHYKMFIGGGKTVEAGSGGVHTAAYQTPAQIRTYFWKGWHGAGGSFLAERPTLFGAGERGAEEVNITPVGRGGGGKHIHVHVHMPGGTTLVGMAEDVGSELGPFVEEGIAKAELLAGFGRA